MKTTPLTLSIADYCQAFARHEVQIDRTYQRSAGIWPVQARSFLIETILKGFPIPNLAIHQVTDLKSKLTRKYIVDGQQRTLAILAFYNNEFKLSRSLELKEAAGRSYSQLDEELQSAFLSYILHFDQFETSSEEDVREYFRRINSFTAPLNSEEQRHAKFQGPMKWMIFGLTQKYSEGLVNLGVLPKQSVIRMSDSKFIAELVHAHKNGITTTSKTTLDAMYRNYERLDNVEDEEKIDEALEDAFEAIIKLKDIRGTSLMKTHVFYSLVLAMIRVLTSWSTLFEVDQSMKQSVTISPRASQNLLKLADALDDPDNYPDFEEFISAASEKTNVKSERIKRTKWLANALVS